MNTPSDFKRGDILRMSVAGRSHVRKPYYVEVVEVAKEYIVTSIPNEHELKISLDNNWDYHIPRMTYMGKKRTHGHLIQNQKLN